MSTDGRLRRIAQRYLFSSGYFSEGENILFGRYKNKRGRVVRLYIDERGVPMVEVEPVPKGRKKNRSMGLYSLWKLPENRTKAASEMPGDLYISTGGPNLLPVEVVATVSEGEVEVRDVSLAACLEGRDTRYTVSESDLKIASLQRQACIIAGRRFDDRLCLLKNRDRGYDAELEIVHLEKNGVEMAVVLDTVTGYLEGVNEYGIGVVNTTLMVVRDEAEGKDKPKSKKKGPLTSKDGPKIFRALSCDNLDDAVESLRTDNGGIRGHTFVADGTRLVSIECSKNHPARIHELDPKRINTRTNHGISYPDAGYTHGIDYASSIVRRWEAQKRLQTIKRPEAAGPALWDVLDEGDSPFNPMRVTDKMRTTSQLTIDTTHPALYLYLVPGHAEVLRRRNLLPDRRKPKIPVRVFRYRQKMEDREPSGKTASELIAKYKEKKKVKTKDGEETTVYVYGPRQVANRNKAKAERIEKLRGQMQKLRQKVRRDVSAADEKLRSVALAIALMDETYERPGNDDSASEGHFGVTTWKVEQVSFRNGNATIKYVGKSGVDQIKKVESKWVVSALKAACKGKGKDACVIEASPSEVNEYLKPLGVTAKDIRGLHANQEMKDRLRTVRREGPKLPEDRKERETLLKKEFKEALEGAAEAVGHEPSTLRSQYLVPGLEDDYMKDGTVESKHSKGGSLLRRAAETGTPVERQILANALVAPVLVERPRTWWLLNAPSLYRIARAAERPRPCVDGLRFPLDVFTVLWHEDADGNRLPDPPESDVAYEQPPANAAYLHSQFPCELVENILLLNDDGTSTEIGGGTKSFHGDLVTTMVRDGTWDVGEAIMVAAQACERCLNVLLHHYGLDDGYPFGSEEYWKAGTRCKMCDHVDNSSEANFWDRRMASPTYDAYVQRKRREGGEILSREQWEAKVLGRGTIEDVGERKPPDREAWEGFRKTVMEKHGLSKFHASYRPEEHHISIGLIAVDEGRRGEGNGSRAMKEVLDWADSSGVMVTLTPSSDFGTSKKRLEKWYSGMGFVPNKGRNKDYRFTDSMVRAPRPKTATKTPAEREDEKVQKMLRKEPKKKPPRYDLRNNRTLDESDQDPDLKGTGGGDSGDRDLSLKWNKVAQRVADRWLGRPKALQAKGKGDSEFQKWVGGKEFPHPDTRHDVKFVSLPPEEQSKIYEEWKSKQQPEDDEDQQTQVRKKPESKKERGREDVEVDLDNARDDVEELEADIEKLHDDVKSSKKAIKELKKLFENASDQNKLQIEQKIKEVKKDLRRMDDKLENKQEELQDAKKRVEELKAERKDPDGAKKRLREEIQRKRQKKIQRAVAQAQVLVKSLLGNKSEIPRDLRSQIEEHLNEMEDEAVEDFALAFKAKLSDLKGRDPLSDAAVEAANSSAKFGDLQGLTNPEDLAERLAQLSYATNVVANPMVVAGKPVGGIEMNDDKYRDRALESFKQFERLHPLLRRSAVDRLHSELRGLDPDTHRAREINAILTGLDVAQIADTGEAIHGRPQPSKGNAALIKKMVEMGNAEHVFKPAEDFFAEDARKTMSQALSQLDARQVADLVTSGDSDAGYSDLYEMIHDETTPDVMREMMKDFLAQDLLNDIWGDRAIRDTMQAAGLADADDPEARAHVLNEAKRREAPKRRKVLEAQERIDHAQRTGGEVDPSDVKLVEGYFNPEGGFGLRENSRSLLDFLREKFKKNVVSPATAVLTHFIESRDPKVLSQEVHPHPDENAEEPRSREEREKERADSGVADEHHGPRDVWQTEDGNWRAKSPKGAPKTFHDKEKAKAYAEGKGREESDEPFSADFGVPVEDKGPNRFASLAQLWLRRVRASHPDAPNRPFVVG